MTPVVEPVYFGLKFYELATLAAIVIGPIVAVAITLITESRRRTREQRVQTMRMLMSTRHLPSDPAYTTAINMIPIDFNDKKKVMAAWNAYIDSIRYRATPENIEANEKQIISKQTKLIFEIMQCLSYKLPETDIQSSAYAAGGFLRRDQIWINAQLAWPRIADALEAQTRLISGGDAADDDEPEKPEQ